ERVVGQLETMTEKPPEASNFLSQVQLPEKWRDEQKQAFRKDLAEAVRSAVYPSLRRYHDFLRDEYLPQAREKVGVSENKGGSACYAAKIKATTGLEMSPEDIHQIGLDEVAKNEAEMRVIAEKLVGSEDIAELK